MGWVVDNWYLIVAGICIIAVIVMSCIQFFKLPTSQQIANVKEWLKLAVAEAEKELGGGTGQLKLRMVYDMAVARFPWVATMIKFECFGKWVDEALEWLSTQLESNEAVKKIVEEKK